MAGLHSYIGVMAAFILLGLLLASPGSEFQVVRILATSDLHCRVRSCSDFKAPGLPRRLLGGWENLAELIRDKRTDASLLLDCGDFAFGSAEGEETQGRAAVRFMNLAGYDAAAIGARDFQGGAENLEILARLARFPLLADPMLDVVLNRRVPLFRPYLIKDVNGVRVGIIGLTDPDIPKLNLEDNTRGLAVDEPVAQLARYLPALQAESADIIIAFGHIPVQDAASLLDSFPELSVVICPDGRGEGKKEGLIPIAPYGQRLGVIDILVHRQGRGAYQVEARSLNVLPGRPDSSKAAALVEELLVKEMDSVVCYCGAEFGPGEDGLVSLGKLVSEAVRRSTGADIAILPLAVVESGLSRGWLKAHELFEAVPFAERLRLVLLEDTLVHEVFRALEQDECAPLLAGADLFVTGDTSRWPLVAQVARIRHRTRKLQYRVATTEQLLERSGIAEKGKLMPRNLTDLWVEWASARDTLMPVPGPKLYTATPGLVRSADSASFPININTATAKLLEQLPGIGPKTAQRIIEYRQAQGRFGSVDELQNVKGIGPKKLEKIRPLATVR